MDHLLLFYLVCFSVFTILDSSLLMSWNLLSTSVTEKQIQIVATFGFASCLSIFLSLGLSKRYGMVHMLMEVSIVVVIHVKIGYLTVLRGKQLLLHSTIIHQRWMKTLYDVTKNLLSSASKLRWRDEWVIFCVNQGKKKRKSKK